MNRLRCVLFDLDGTLVDTAPDLVAAANAMRLARGLEVLPIAQLRPYVSQGARGMLREALGITPEQADYAEHQQDYLNRYAAALCVQSTLFEGMEAVLQELEARAIKWGIVTNKHTRFTQPLVAALGLTARAACVVSGDTTPHAKPHPAPMLHAAQLAAIEPNQCIYVGDDERDILAGKAAHMLTIAAAYGYCGGSAAETWGADYLVNNVTELQHTLRELIL